jgi:hypothetical protein
MHQPGVEWVVCFDYTPALILDDRIAALRVAVRSQRGWADEERDCDQPGQQPFGRGTRFHYATRADSLRLNIPV